MEYRFGKEAQQAFTHEFVCEQKAEFSMTGKEIISKEDMAIEEQRAAARAAFRDSDEEEGEEAPAEAIPTVNIGDVRIHVAGMFRVHRNKSIWDDLLFLS